MCLQPELTLQLLLSLLTTLSPTSYQLLHPAMFGLQKYGDFL